MMLVTMELLLERERERDVPTGETRALEFLIVDGWSWRRRHLGFFERVFNFVILSLNNLSYFILTHFKFQNLQKHPLKFWICMFCWLNVGKLMSI